MSIPSTIIEYALLLLWLVWVAQALFGARNVYMFLRRERKKHIEEQSNPKAFNFTPDVCVIVPVKGVDDQLEGHMQGLLEQDYPSYRLIFTTESCDDSAYLAIKEYLSGSPEFADLPEKDGTVLNWTSLDQLNHTPGLKSVHLVDSGLATNEAQKIHNSIAAMQLMNDDDEAVVYADADAVMGSDWLKRMVGPLVNPKVGCTTAWRWLVPELGAKANLPTKVACIINSSIVTLQGRDRRNCAWGGSMAVLRQTLKDIDMPKPWRGTFNDDVNLSNAINELGKRVYLVPNMLVRGPVTFTWASLLEFGRRQYMHARVYQPASWRVGPIGTSLYLAGFLTAVAALFLFPDSVTWSFAITTLITVYIIDFIRGRLRKQVAKTSLQRQAYEELSGVWMLEYFATPFWMFVHWLCCIASMFGNHFTWGGIRYKIHAPHNIEIVSRS
ncbi:glycosyltransferase family 2 protein [Planctomycetota bacterium]|nr:glycosyltransferase family 2 protein [Planctomycetota bacterium]